MNMHLLNCNKTDAEYLHVKFSMVFFGMYFFYLLLSCMSPSS